MRGHDEHERSDCPPYDGVHGAHCRHRNSRTAMLRFRLAGVHVQTQRLRRRRRPDVVRCSRTPPRCSTPDTSPVHALR